MPCVQAGTKRKAPAAAAGDGAGGDCIDLTREGSPPQQSPRKRFKASPGPEGRTGVAGKGRTLVQTRLASPFKSAMGGAARPGADVMVVEQHKVGGRDAGIFIGGGKGKKPMPKNSGAGISMQGRIKRDKRVEERRKELLAAVQKK